MNGVDFILIGLIILAVALVAFKLISNKRQGKGTCSCVSGTCGGCPVKENKRAKIKGS